MNCYVCAGEGREQAAVGLCRHCQVALCMDHLAEARTHGRGGMHVTCSHLVPSLRAVGTPASR